MGKFGFYEAIDYTPARLPRGKSHVVIPSFMSHHQGMTFLSLAYLLLDKPMQKLFECGSFLSSYNAFVTRTYSVNAVLFTGKAAIFRIGVNSLSAKEAPVRVFNDPNTPNPNVHLLSNGRYHVMATNAGGGYSRWNDLSLTRWREDSTCDNWGTFCYIRDTVSGQFWSTTYQPTLKRFEEYAAIFSEAKAEFRRRDHDIETYSELVVSPEDDIELRRVRLTNRSSVHRTIEVTSYAEVVLATPAS